MNSVALVGLVHVHILSKACLKLNLVLWSLHVWLYQKPATKAAPLGKEGVQGSEVFELWYRFFNKADHWNT